MNASKGDDALAIKLKPMLDMLECLLCLLKRPRHASCKWPPSLQRDLDLHLEVDCFHSKWRAHFQLSMITACYA